MVFSSIPAYLDPANWQQQPTHHHLTGSGGNNNNNNSHLLQPPPPAPPLSEPQSGGSTGSIRPGSMADRARMANIPMPEAALKCPRCDSTNTKFCYFNNYSLSQPRHFCKTCRRYWTRGGALRNVPVGGGCRRNKRSKGSGGTSSKSPASSSDRPTGSAGSSGANIPSNSSIGGTADMMGASGMSSQLPPLRFMTPFTDHHFTGATDMGLSYGLNYGGVGDHLNFQIGTSTGSLLSGGGLDHQQQQWARFQQQTPLFPFLAGGSGSLDMTSSAAAAGGLFESSGGVVEAVSGYQARPMRPSTGIISNSQMAPVKMEDHHYQQRQQQQQQQQQELNFSRQFLGINNNPGGSHDHQNHNQYWINGGVSSGAWTDLSGFSSTTSTTTNHHPL